MPGARFLVPGAAVFLLLAESQAGPPRRRGTQAGARHGTFGQEVPLGVLIVSELNVKAKLK